MRRFLVALAAVALLSAFTPALTAAAQPDVYVYHGALTGGQLTCGGVTVPVPTRGNWTVTVTPGMAQVDATEFHDWGEGWVHQMAMGGAEWGRWEVVSAEPGSFHLTVLAFGGPMRVDSYLHDGQISFHLEPYAGGCDSADVFGELLWSRPGS